MFDNFNDFIQYVENAVGRSLGGVSENDGLDSVLSFDEQSDAFEAVENIIFRPFSATETEEVDTFGELYLKARE